MTKFMHDFMAEIINYGGMAATRAEAYADSLKLCTERAAVCFGMEAGEARKAGHKAAEQFAFGCQAQVLNPNEVASRLRFDPTTGEPKKR